MLCRSRVDCVVVNTPAKLNLFLNVLGKRADGFHELVTLMVSVDLYDTLAFQSAPAGTLSLSCRDAGTRRSGQPARDTLGAGEDNLVLRAARLLQQSTGSATGAQIELRKRIPVAAGLAGGSSDAAATLMGLNRLWNLNLSNAELMTLAAILGSDIPFFLSSSTAAVCRGRGEIVEPFNMRSRMWFVVARPATGLSTAQVFRACRPSTEARPVEPLLSALAHGRLSQAGEMLFNSLQPPAEQLNADVVALKEVFSKESFVGHQMSGSGTSYFGLCRSRRHAASCAARIAAKRLGDVVIVSNRP